MCEKGVKNVFYMLTVTNYSDGIMLTRNLNQQTKKARVLTTMKRDCAVFPLQSLTKFHIIAF